ncbi:Histone-lysine N-methyltransferase SETMAR, partial [Dufourea novaeangliae]
SMKKILKLGNRSELKHPPYSLEIASTNYHIFLVMDNHLRNRRFQNRQDFERELQRFFDTKEEHVYTKVIEMLLNRVEKIIEAKGI